MTTQIKAAKEISTMGPVEKNWEKEGKSYDYFFRQWESMEFYPSSKRFLSA